MVSRRFIKLRYAVVWNEFVHERESELVRSIYPDDIHATIAAALGREGGRCLHRYALIQGRAIRVRRELTNDGWCLQITGRDVTGLLVGTVLDDIERALSPGVSVRKGVDTGPS